MTENEAIEKLKIFPEWNKVDEWLSGAAMEELVNTCNNALEEIQKYRAIGTIEFLTDMKSNYVEVLSDLRQYQKIGTVEECQQNKAIAEESIHKEHLVTIQDTSVPTTLCYTEDRCWYGPDTWQCGDITR